MLLQRQFERPAFVLLSAMWTLAVLLCVAAFAVSAVASPSASAQAPASLQRDGVSASSVESVTASPMLARSGSAISKDKLD